MRKPASTQSETAEKKGLKPGRLKPLPRAFYDRDPRRVARELIGKILVRRDGRRLRTGRIVEVEAYLGTDDPAAHSAAGKTLRNAVLFGPPGHAYVYFIYGNHFCLNVSCLPQGDAGCVLIRALEPLAGLELMAKARGLIGVTTLNPRVLTSGPGRLCQALSITRLRDNAKDLTSARPDLFFAEDTGFKSRVVVSKRIGITKAAEKPWRYLLAKSRFVSHK